MTFGFKKLEAWRTSWVSQAEHNQGLITPVEISGSFMPFEVSHLLSIWRIRLKSTLMN